MKLLLLITLLFLQQQINDAHPAYGSEEYNNRAFQSQTYSSVFPVQEWNDMCSKIYETLSKANLQYTDIDTIFINGRSKNNQEFSLKLLPQDIFPLEKVVNVNHQLTIDIILKYEKSLLAWLKNLNIPNTENIDLSMILKIEPSITLDSIKANVGKWSSIFGILAQIPKHLRLNIDGNINLNWIGQNEDQWKNILVSQGLPKNLIDSIDWDLYISKYPHADPMWINQNPKDFIALLISIQNQKMPVENIAPIIPSFTQKDTINLKKWLTYQNIPFSNIDWSLVTKLEPVISWSIIQQNPTLWIQKFNHYIQLSNAKTIPIKPNIDVSWTMENPSQWNNMLINQGIPADLLQTIDWETYFTKFPYSTPQWISTNIKQFVQQLLEVKGQKLPSIDVDIPISVSFMKQNKNRIKKLFVTNNIPYVDGLDWNLVLKYEKSFTLNDILRNFNVWSSKLATYATLSKITHLNIPTDINLNWIVRNTRRWNDILKQQGIPEDLIYSIDWQLFISRYPHATPHWIMQNVMAFLDILLTIQGQKMPVKVTQVSPTDKWIQLFDQNSQITVDWISNNIDQWNKIVSNFGVNVPNMDWVVFLKKFPYISVPWIKQNINAFVNMINLFKGASLQFYWNLFPTQNIDNNLAMWVKQNPTEWIKYLIQVGFPNQYLLTVNWELLFNENGYITLDWIKSHVEEWLALIMKYQNTIKDDAYKWNIIVACHPYISREWVLRFPDIFRWILRTARIDDKGINWVKFFQTHNDFNFQTIVNNMDNFLSKFKNAVAGFISGGTNVIGNIMHGHHHLHGHRGAGILQFGHNVHRHNIGGSFGFGIQNRMHNDFNTNDEKNDYNDHVKSSPQMDKDYPLVDADEAEVYTTPDAEERIGSVSSEVTVSRSLLEQLNNVDNAIIQP